MLITEELIKGLNPCFDRYENYVKYYGHLALTKAQFIGRKNITQSDKLWVAFRLMPKENIVLAAADIAESVLHLYEAKYPDDNRPRKAIEAARNGNRDATNAARATAYAAYTAANATAYAAYTNASKATKATKARVARAAKAANAAAYAANAAAYAAEVANAAHAANAAYAAAYTASAANAVYTTRDKDNQEKFIRKIVLKYWR